jgi:hypothetical protein
MSKDMNLSRPVEPGAATITANALGPRLIFTTFRGTTNFAMAEAARDQFLRLVATMDSPVWISDATQLTGFDPRSLALGHRWFSAFKARGGRDCLIISEWDRAMMAARTMALGVGIRIQNFSTFEDAKDAASKLLEAR